MKIVFFQFGLLMLSFSLSLFFSCGDSSDESDTESNSGDGGQDDDDWDDADQGDAHDDDDDAVTDNQDPPSNRPPRIFNVYWDPNPVAWDDQAHEWISNLLFEICDPDMNMTGGNILVYYAGTDDLALEVEWYDWDGYDYSDCNNPMFTGLPISFGSDPIGPDFDSKVCIDFQITDAAGLRSNKATNICVSML